MVVETSVSASRCISFNEKELFTTFTGSDSML